jgi:hypothetical protein
LDNRSTVAVPIVAPHVLDATDDPKIVESITRVSSPVNGLELEQRKVSAEVDGHVRARQLHIGEQRAKPAISLDYSFILVAGGVAGVISAVVVSRN